MALLGYFNAPVRCEWLRADPRKVKLLEDLIYTDSNGKVWVAPKGSIVDGASIPRFFWSKGWSPFVGLYRRASVIHDVYCENKERPWQDVHKVFHEMMLQDGVAVAKAYIMAKAVWKFGPRW